MRMNSARSGNRGLRRDIAAALPPAPSASMKGAPRQMHRCRRRRLRYSHVRRREEKLADSAAIRQHSSSPIPQTRALRPLMRAVSAHRPEQMRGRRCSGNRPPLRGEFADTAPDTCPTISLCGQTASPTQALGPCQLLAEHGRIKLAQHLGQRCPGPSNHTHFVRANRQRRRAWPRPARMKPGIFAQQLQHRGVCVGQSSENGLLACTEMMVTLACTSRLVVTRAASMSTAPAVALRRTLPTIIITSGVNPCGSAEGGKPAPRRNLRSAHR